MEKQRMSPKSPAMETSQSGTDMTYNVSFRYAPVAPTASSWVMLIQIDGTVNYEISGKQIVLEKAGACLLRPTDTLHFHGCNAAAMSFLVNVDYMYSLSSLVDVNLYSDLLRSTELLCFTLSESLFSAVEEKSAVSQSDTQNSRLWMLQFQELYIHFLAQYANSAPRYPQWLRKLIVTLENPNWFGVPMSQLVSTTPYSYSRLIRLFHQYTGVSLITYVTDVKIRHAKQLLRSTDMTMLAIASKLEFSVSYFNKLFKKKVGVTPGEYRKTHKEI